MQQSSTMQNWNSSRKKQGNLPNWGRTTFYKISNDYLKTKPVAFNQCKNMNRAQTQRYKLRYLGITQEQADLSKEYTYQANLALTAATWDAQHLDRFLTKSQWGEPNKRNIPEQFPSVQLDSYDLAEQQESIGKSMKLPIENFNEYGLDSNQIQEHVNMANSKDLLKHSPFYRQQSRWDPRVNNNSTFPDQMSKFNHLITQKKNSLKTKQDYFKKNLTLDALDVDKDKVNMTTQPVTFQHPKERLEELNNLKKNGKKFRRWKK